MEYKPFVVDGRVRNYHISECENISYDELAERDYFQKASDTEKTQLMIAKCGTQINRFENSGTEWYEDYWNTFINEINKLMKELSPIKGRT